MKKILFILLFSCITFSWADNQTNIEDLKKQCNNNQVDACEKLADIFYLADSVPQDLKQATTLYQKACDNGGKPRNCQNVAAAYLTEEGVDRDLKKAFNYAKKGCDQKFEDACRVLNAVKDIQNNHSKEDTHRCIMTKDKISCLKHAVYLEEECNKNQYGACYMLGLEYDKNPVQAVRTNKEKAYQFYKKARIRFYNTWKSRKSSS